MTVRTQVTLDPELHRKAKRKASELGISFAELVRRLLQRDLEEPDRRAEVSAVFDLGTSGGSDVARRKEAMLGEAIERERGR